MAIIGISKISVLGSNPGTPAINIFIERPRCPMVVSGFLFCNKRVIIKEKKALNIN